MNLFKRFCYPLQRSWNHPGVGFSYGIARDNVLWSRSRTRLYIGDTRARSGRRGLEKSRSWNSGWQDYGNPL